MEKEFRSGFQSKRYTSVPLTGRKKLKATEGKLALGQS